jgi:benzylsuccinate CoA-transferase BbsE subunit
MEEKQKTEGILGPYRVLDLTDEKGLLCGKLLGDLGADVIKIERPGGDAARSLAPFYHDEADPEKSLFWFALNTSKRGITLDIETADGQEIFKKLVKSADFVIESFAPGYMGKLGLGYSALERLNPRVVMISITPFGQTGPYKDYKAPDIVAWAMGGQMYVSGGADGPPVRISHHSQAYLHAAAEAAVGAMVALSYRQLTGQGQHVDVSIQECVTRVSHQATTILWDTNKVIPRRGEGMSAGGTHRTEMWRCKDGYVIWLYWFGPGAKRYSLPFVEWMDSEGMADDFLKGFDWESFNFSTVTQEVNDKIEKPTSKFFMRHTKAELYEGALERNIVLYPVYTHAEVLEDAQLADRGYWVEVKHPKLGASITYPGAFWHASEVPPRISRRAPLIGEHNQEIFEKELGMSRQEILTLKQAEVI